VNGRLAPEIIQRIVRQRFGRLRFCYEKGLVQNPDLQGRVTAKFVIDEDGNVASVVDGGSDLPDKTVVQCVLKAFADLKFPMPDGGKVIVVYPTVFSPAEGSKPATSAKPSARPAASASSAH